MTFQDHLRALSELAHEAHAAGWIKELPSFRESVHVAVIGEIKRGKSTFLNALMGEKVFPSRSSVCTTAVTFLEDGTPAIEAIYRPEVQRAPETRPVHEGENIFDCLQDMVAKPNLLGKKGNPDARDLDSVVVTYPNRFATDGVRLVDTPGVNDPESWREEITFQFLPQVDAALMLLDPQQPLSKSEMDFLQNRATRAVKDQLLVVVSRCDEVKPADLEKSVGRIRRELESVLPNARIFTVASKPALEAKKTGDPIPEAWQDFERSLDAFLHAGKAGALLLSRAKTVHDELESVKRSKEAHLESLSRSGAEEHQRLQDEEKELQRIHDGLAMLRHRGMTLLAGHRERLTSRMDQFLSSQQRRLRSMDDQELSVFMSHFLRDLQENREAWLLEIASEMEAALREDVTGLIGKETSVRAFKIPELSSLRSAPTFSAPRKDDSSGFLPGIVAGIVGTIFGGPLIGAGVAFLGKTLFGDDADSRKAEALNRFRSECNTFLGQCVITAKDDVQNLLQGMSEGWIPQFFTPFDSEIARQQDRVRNAKEDLGKGETERAEIQQGIRHEMDRLLGLLNRSQAFLSLLGASGNR